MRRSQRVVALTRRLIEEPGRWWNLDDLATEFGAAKSSLSEDVALVREVLAAEGAGVVESRVGAGGGIRFLPLMTAGEATELANELCRRLTDPRRILAGGFLYLGDLVADPVLLERIGRLFATLFRDRGPEAVMTVEARGIPIALMTARALRVPLVMVRRSARLSEGPVVTMNYLSSSGARVETMTLAKKALEGVHRLLIVDDFMRNGGSARGLVDLAREFEVEPVGVGVLIETAEPAEKRLKEYVAVALIEQVDVDERRVRVRMSPRLPGCPPAAAAGTSRLA
ncbi:pur operon repressor [Limnochorda pilosa]|uniref:LacI family transcriptional regulator n=1 Tax=Limnochorda pilosa TaxID=1555112 RepID=A0A0K2SQK7_LIMPI|nr:pur operon repressor [Limnochorda pilosa]BAS29410.1 LacI family transcriptional regulator [Limnochorda pilosa]